VISDLRFDVPGEVGALMEPGELWNLALRASTVPANQEIVEIGSWAGGSAAWLCAGSRAGERAHITCIDPWTDWIDPPADTEIVFGDDALAHFREVTDPTLVTPLRAESQSVAPMWTKPIGLLFIDGLHTYEACRNDLTAWVPYVAYGGTVIVHDCQETYDPKYWWTEGPTRAIREFDGLTFDEVVDFSWVGRR